MFKYLLFSILFSFSIVSYSQISITGFTNYALGINTNKEKAISFEAKIFTNNYIQELPLEISGFYNLKTKEYHRFSIGLGINTSPLRGFDELNSIVIPTSLEIFPIKDFKKIAIVIELTPEIRIDEDVVLRSLIGLRYSFEKK